MIHFAGMAGCAEGPLANGYDWKHRVVSGRYSRGGKTSSMDYLHEDWDDDLQLFGFYDWQIERIDNVDRYVFYFTDESSAILFKLKHVKGA